MYIDKYYTIQEENILGVPVNECNFLIYLSKHHNLSGTKDIQYFKDPYTMAYQIRIRFNLLFRKFNWDYEEQWLKNKRLIMKNFKDYD